MSKESIADILGNPVVVYDAEGNRYESGPLDDGPDPNCDGEIVTTTEAEYAGEMYARKLCKKCCKCWYERAE